MGNLCSACDGRKQQFGEDIDLQASLNDEQGRLPACSKINEVYDIQNQIKIHTQFKQLRAVNTHEKLKKRTTLKSAKLLLNSGEEFGEYYKYGRLLGQGTHSVLVKVQNKKTHETRAMKRVEAGYVIDLTGKTKAMVHIDNLKDLDHPNITKNYEFFSTQNHIYIIMDLHEGGDLLDKIQQMNYFSEQTAAIIFRQLLRAIDYCHQNGVIHRDIKPEKILFNNADSIKELKLCSFGESIKVNDKDEMLSELVGTPYYVAPEVLLGKYNHKCDIWSAGVILAVMLTGENLFQGNSAEEIIQKIQKGQFDLGSEKFKKISLEGRGYIRKLLNMDYNKRYDASQALQDPWLVQFTETEEEQLNLPNLISQLKNLKQYKKGQVLYEAIHSFMVDNLITQEEKQELMQTFQLLDTNGDGRLSKEEIIQGYQKISSEGIKMEALNKIFENIDQNDNGSIDFMEWLQATISQQNILSNERLNKAFSLFDKDNNGYISLEELKQFFIAENAEEQDDWDELIKEFDYNNDGLISRQEFIQSMQKKLQFMQDNESNKQSRNQSQAQQNSNNNYISTNVSNTVIK